MSKPHLIACTGCARHVRVSESACPFCGAALSDDLRSASAPKAPGARLTRAALFALGAGTLALATGCSSSGATGSDDAGSAGIDSGSGFDSGGLQPVYGAPADAGSVVFDSGGAQPVYGAPAADAGTEFDSGGGGPVYGAPPILDGGH